jgi:hypothetical protein
MGWILVIVTSVVTSVVTGFLGALEPASSDEVSDGTELVATYSQADAHGPRTGAVGPSEVVDTDAELSDVVRRLGARLDTAPVEAVVLRTHVLVVGGYHRCTETSRVVVDPDAPHGLRLDVVADDEQVSCAWSPFTVDVHAVPR